MLKKNAFQSQKILGTLLFFPIVLFILFFARAFAKNESSAVNTVPKKVFAQMLAKSLNIKIQQLEKCFKDVDSKDLATPAICALRKKNIFVGSKKMRFYPNSPTTWKFAINSICKANGWVPKKTFSSCLSYAEKNDLISSAISSVKQQKPISSSELLLFFKVVEPKTQKIPVSQSLPPLSFTPFPEETVAANWFSNIKLNTPMPNHFYLNEVYFLEGDVIDSSPAEVFAFLCKDKQGCDNSIDFIAKTSGNHFVIPIYLKEPGNFQIGIILGKSGQSRVADISVLPAAPDEPAGGKIPNSLSAQYVEGKTTFNWNGEGAITRMVIFQEKQRKDYIFRQNVSSFSPSSEDFASFISGEAFWFIKKNSLESPIQKITLTTQEYRKVAPDINIQSLQEVLHAPGHFSFSGKSTVAVNKNAAVTLPDGHVYEINFSASNVPPGKDFTIETDFNATGTYIFEINNLQGDALLNVPIFVGSFIPLLPDALTINKASLSKKVIQNLDSEKNELFKLINADRKAYSLPALELSSELNAIAQAHSADMVNRNFFGHINPSGLSPEARRQNAKITTPIRENLGKGATLKLVEVGLMRSPIHRAAILDPAMQRIGLGIAKDADGYYFITQDFASNPVSTNDLANITNNLFDLANIKRVENSLPKFTEDSILQDIANVWSNKMARDGFFGTNDLSETSIVSMLRNKGVNSSVQIYIIQTDSKSQLEEEMLNQDAFNNAYNRSIGIGVSVNDIGDLFMTTIYSP